MPAATTQRLNPAYRWIILLIMSFVSFASYYIYDSITPLGTLLKDEMGLSGTDYGLLFSAYSDALSMRSWASP